MQRLLKGVYNPEFRNQAVREAYHRLRRSVAFVNGGKFKVKSEEEQQIWNECSRLLTNRIIYYNTSGSFEFKKSTTEIDVEA